MRITGGSCKGRKIIPPQGRLSQEIRPTSDKVREALFSILGDKVHGAIILDLFAGTGALGMEGLSRGAKAAIFVDSSRQALRLIHANLNHLFADPQASLLTCRLDCKSAAVKIKKQLPDSLCFDLVFLDPPYKKNLAKPTLLMVENSDILAENALIVVEENSREELPQKINALTLIDKREYGTTGIWIYQH